MVMRLVMKATGTVSERVLIVEVTVVVVAGIVTLRGLLMRLMVMMMSEGEVRISVDIGDESCR